MNVQRLREALQTAQRSDADIKKELEEPSFLACMKTFLLDKEGLKKLLPVPAKPLLDLMDDNQVAISASPHQVQKNPKEEYIWLPLYTDNPARKFAKTPVPDVP